MSPLQLHARLTPDTISHSGSPYCRVAKPLDIAPGHSRFAWRKLIFDTGLPFCWAKTFLDFGDSTLGMPKL